MFVSIEDTMLCDVYRLVKEKVENEKPELLNKMTTNLGLDLFDHYL